LVLFGVSAVAEPVFRKHVSGKKAKLRITESHGNKKLYKAFFMAYAF
jgi:hypothetical protein